MHDLLTLTFWRYICILQRYGQRTGPLVVYYAEENRKQGYISPLVRDAGRSAGGVGLLINIELQGMIASNFVVSFSMNELLQFWNDWQEHGNHVFCKIIVIWDNWVIPSLSTRLPSQMYYIDLGIIRNWWNIHLMKSFYIWFGEFLKNLHYFILMTQDEVL